MNFTKLTEEEQLTILANVAEDKGIADNAVERDYWISMVLRAIFSLPHATAFVFKGGTSPSKGWGLVGRFSEDIDLAIDSQYLGFTNIGTKSQRTKLWKDSKGFIDGSFVFDVETRLKESRLSKSCRAIAPEISVSDPDSVVLFVEYSSVPQTKMQYTPKRVKIETSCRSPMEPSEDVKMRSMIEEVYPGEEFSLPILIIPTAMPGRTFLEKVFLLHEEFNRSNGCTHIERITRHTYDTIKMMDRPFAMEAVQDIQLHEDTVTHRKKLTTWGGLNYTSHLPHIISFLPPKSIEDVLRDDYKQMQIGLIYANAPSFDEIMERSSELQNRFRTLVWKNNRWRYG